MHTTTSASARTHAAPLRGTQSLVGVMAFVWSHPSLSALEILWRWLVAAPMLWIAWHALQAIVVGVHPDAVALGTLTFFDPVRSVAVLAGQAQLYLPAARSVGRWWAPSVLLVWAAMSALGKTVVLRRTDPALRPRLALSALCNLLRTLSFFGFLALLSLAMRSALRATITGPGARGDEPNIVLFTAAAVALVLAAFLAWSLVIWRLDLQPLLGMTRIRLSSTQHAQLRSKLIETNLVMGIVRVALLVLALTFSASPLPFQSQETQAYINVWWVGVALFYVVSSDFFHVVRRVTYLRLLESIFSQNNAGHQRAS